MENIELICFITHLYEKLLLLISLALCQWMLVREEEQVQPSSLLAWFFEALVFPMQTTLEIRLMNSSQTLHPYLFLFS